MTEKKKPSAMSVSLDGDLVLALNRLREEIIQGQKNAGLPMNAPTIGWLTRMLLREKLGLPDKRNDIPAHL